MDENEMHQWLIDSFGQLQGEVAWNQISQLPEEVRQQLLSQDVTKLPKPDEVQALMQALADGGLNSMNDMQRTVDQGPVNIKLSQSIALQQTNGQDSESTVSAQEGRDVRKAMSEANLWLDSVSDFDPAPGDPQVLTRAGWVESTLDAWARFAAPVARSMNDALASVLSERLGDSFNGEIEGMFAGPIPIPIPEGMKDPAQLIKLLGNTSFAMQLGRAAGAMSHEVRGSFDQGIALQKNPAGALIAQNSIEYAKSLEIDQAEVLAFLALQEVAHARLFAHVPWLMPRFEALIGKYARGIDIDLDAMEEQLRDARTMNPEALSGAVNLTNVAIPDTEEQKDALSSLENLLALVEGWVDCVTWKAGMAHIPHIEQLREMLRRERAAGGLAEVTFESLLGMQLRPKRIREAAALWENVDIEQGTQDRDAKWSHPDLLPVLSDSSTRLITHPSQNETTLESGQGAEVHDQDNAGSADIDWDAELSKLLDNEDGVADESTATDTGMQGKDNNSTKSRSPEDHEGTSADGEAPDASGSTPHTDPADDGPTGPNL